MKFKIIGSFLMRPVVIFAVIVVAYGTSHVAMGVSTSVWTSQTQKDFKSGKPKDVSISSKGEVSLSLRLVSHVKTEELYVWCLAEDSQGNLYAGTGTDGRIFRITPDGASSLLFDSPEVNIHSLAIDSADNIYAGTSPDGLVYKISPDGQSTTLFKAEEKYVWALALDEAGNLYAGTGTDGRIHKITPAGENSVLFDSEETHIMSLLYAKNTLYAGSEGSGIIYKITPEGQAFVVYDTDEKEIHSLAMDAQGNLFAAATTDKEPGGGQPQPNAPAPPPSAAPKEKESRESSIYQVTPDGVVSKIWASESPLILSLVVDDNNNLTVGTGDEGMIYTVTPEKEFASLVKCEEAQVLAIRKSSTSTMFIATGNPGRIYRLSAEHPQEGTLESEPYDTKIISKWGDISWEHNAPESTAISFVTRTGNSSKPDKTWSEWSAEYTAASGQRITSPPARFIQWRAKLTTTDVVATPLLKRVDVAYMQENIRPEIASIQIDPRKAEKKPSPPSAPPSAQKAPGSEPSAGGAERTVEWQAIDPNNDSMEYTIYYKGVDEQTWKLLKDELEKASYSWDSTSMPDGRYQVKIVASDKLSNPAGLAKTAEKISDPFEIDNTQPVISDITIAAVGDGTFRVAYTAEDRTSRINEATFSIDGQKWQLVFPIDNISDARKEEFSFTTPSELEAGEHTVVVKVTDAVGNVGTGKQVFTK